VARIELAPDVLDDFERIIAHLRLHDSPGWADRGREIITAIDILASSPLIGRLSDSGNRELIIGHDARGYVALYRHAEQLDTVFVLAVRGQKEAGYARG